ncbi:hypothetical protein GR174_001732 [Salmonella enterica subsp. enterica]|nr:hypothetical protein [Salmonella enterica subsp. enterica serovar Hvittingfoss]
MMIFFEVVQYLRQFHQQLWFSTGTHNSNVDIVKPCRWKSAAIFSPGGKRLASMVGSADEWKLEPDYWKPGPPPQKGGPHYCVLLTDLHFAQAVKEIMS